MISTRWIYTARVFYLDVSSDQLIVILQRTYCFVASGLIATHGLQSIFTSELLWCVVGFLVSGNAVMSCLVHVDEVIIT